MRNYSVHSLKKNQKISKIWNVKKADFQNFIRLSGDKNPIHSNFNYAVSKGYKNIIAPGFLLGSKVSGIIGTFLPGKRWLLLEEKLIFKSPIYPGDTLRIEILVKDLNKSLSVVALKVNVTKKRLKVSVGELLCKIL